MSLADVRKEAFESIHDLDEALRFYEEELRKDNPVVWHGDEIIMTGEEARVFLQGIVSAGRDLHAALVACMPFQGRLS